MKHPAIYARIEKVLEKDVKEAELGHTMLHGINVMDKENSLVQKEEEKYEAEILQRKKTLKSDCLNEALRDDELDE